MVKLSDIEALNRSRKRFKDLRDYAQGIVDTVRDPLMILDTDLRVRRVNRSFCQTFNVSSKETLKHSVFTLGHGQWKIPRLKHLLSEIFSKGSQFMGFKVDHQFPKIGRKTMLLNARQLPGAGNHDRLALLAMEDITERTQAEQTLKKFSRLFRKHSLTDDLTHLYNRRGFLSLGECYLKTAHQTKKGISLFFADVDGLKQINDQFGHSAGDRALREVARILKKTFRKSDILARIGGDEFAIITAQCRPCRVMHLMNRLQAGLKHPSTQNKYLVPLSLSLGVTHSDSDDACSIEELMAKADKLMYENKQQKKT